MKKETLRRVRNMKKLLKKGANIWSNGNFRILWFEDPTPTKESFGMPIYHCVKRVFGHLRLP